MRDESIMYFSGEGFEAYRVSHFPPSDDFLKFLFRDDIYDLWEEDNENNLSIAVTDLDDNGNVIHYSFRQKVRNGDWLVSDKRSRLKIIEDHMLEFYLEENPPKMITKKDKSRAYRG
jgi:hypothetical protein